MLVEPRVVVAVFVGIAGCGEAGGEGETSGSTSLSSGMAMTSSGDASSGDGSSDGGSGGVPTTGGSEASSGSGEAPIVEGWLRSFGAPEQQRPGGIGFDASGALWVAGDVFGAIDLGMGPLAGDGSGLYLAKFAEDGSTLLAQAMFPDDGAATLTLTSGLAVDGAGAVIVTGWLEGTYTIGGEKLAANELDMFVGKWDADGTPRWGRRFGEADWQVGHAVAVGKDDEIWVVGAALAGFMAGDIAVTGTGSTGIVVLRLTPEGTPEFGLWRGVEGDQEATSLAVCDDGAVLVAGWFTTSMQWQEEAPVVQSAGGKDMFVARLDGDGSPGWMNHHGGAADDYATHVACGQEGVFAGVVTGAAQIGEEEFSPVEQADTVLGRVTSDDGALLWVAGITGPEAQRPGGLALRGDGEVLVAVSSAGEATLGDRGFVAEGEDVLLARYASMATTPDAVTGLGGAGMQRGGPLAAFGDAVAIAATIAGGAAWPGLPAVTAAGAQDLALLRVVGP
jgi:hypothetical protein